MRAKHIKYNDNYYQVFILGVGACITHFLRSGLENTLSALFLNHRQELEAYLSRRLRDKETAADLAQETFVRFAEVAKRDGFAVDHARSYLFRTAHNLAIDYIRHNANGGRIRDEDYDLTLVEDRAPTPEAEADHQSELRHLQKLMQQLPERTREVLVLCRVQGKTYKQAARLLHISESSVQKHLAQAIAFAISRTQD